MGEERQAVKPVSDEEVQAAVQPEIEAGSVTVGGKTVSVVPLMRRWQSLFYKAALPLFAAELEAPEAIIKAAQDGSYLYTSLSGTLVDCELKADGFLDEAAAVVLASKLPGAENDPRKFIDEQKGWLLDHSTTDELRRLVEAQAEKERLVQRVGERSPVRFARLLNLAGATDVTPDSLRQILSSLLRKLRESTGAGSSTSPNSTG